jgi:glycine/D-amino acid oxidase-like deaminating enzyme
MRVCVAGGGLAGSLLAWRLAQLSGVDIELLLGNDRPRDATGASGGAVRAYEPLADQRQLAIASLTELLGSPVLQEWADFRPGESVYLRAAGAGLAAEVAEIESALPGSAELLDAASFAASARGRGWAGLSEGIVVLERQAGYLSPARLRDAVVADLSARPRVAVRAAALETVASTAAGSVRCVVAGSASEHDVVVLAAGAWTPDVLRASGLPSHGYRTKSIQYTVYATGEWRPPIFVDDISGLYGKPTVDGGLLLGMPTTEWGVPAGRPPVARAGQDAAMRQAIGRFPLLRLGAVRTQLSAADCYCDPPVLSLRMVADSSPGLLTFTGGSGGSVKTALAASQRAATAIARPAVSDWS